ncbi:MAG TPA: hypothetical protein VJN95_15830 [Gemmatimonadales bacterium]|nr:hypothetical protein [Gemmatimonadales bacterium]
MPRPSVGGYRLGMWLLFIVGLVNLAVAVRGLLHGANNLGGVFALAVFFVCIGGGAWLGFLGGRALRQARDQESRTDAILLLVSELGRQDDDTLNRIARQGGPAAEAARLVLQGRAEKRAKE